jgi:hypothetical protein
VAAAIIFLEKNGLKIVFQPSHSDGITHYEALFSNTSTAPMDQIMFQLAAPKVYIAFCFENGMRRCKGLQVC